MLRAWQDVSPKIAGSPELLENPPYVFSQGRLQIGPAHGEESEGWTESASQAGLGYPNEIFAVSYAKEQRKVVENLISELRLQDISVAWDRDISPGVKWRDNLNNAIKSSRHFLLYCTVNTKASVEVNREIRIFRESSRNDPSRRLSDLNSPDAEDKHVPTGLGELQRAKSLGDVIVHIFREDLRVLTQRLSDIERKVEQEKRNCVRSREEHIKVAEARKYYQHRRFWGPFAKNGDVHIFTCGRDIPPDPARPRGTGGLRTNIDKWDYQAVLDIAHYFASNYPGTKLRSEDPASKLQQEDIDQVRIPRCTAFRSRCATDR